jgi:hypothetical protein
MKTKILIFKAAVLLIITSASLTAHGHSRHGDDRGWSAEKKRDVVKTFGFSSAAGLKTLVIDNLRGSISVKSYTGDSVRLVIHETFHAGSDDELAEAQRKISVEFDSSDNRIFACVKTPWRCNSGSARFGDGDDDNDCCCEHESDYDYDADCDFEINVPAKIELKLRTVNAGDITVDGVEGTMNIRNVNGAIDMTNIAGGGRIGTVNGDVRVTFAKNPVVDCKFGTINGELEVEFPDDLSANVNLKTMNGQVYTSYAVKDVPHRTFTAEMKGAKRVYRGNDSYSVQIGAGGPALSFDTLNGNIYILKHGDADRNLN